MTTDDPLTGPWQLPSLLQNESRAVSETAILPCPFCGSDDVRSSGNNGYGAFWVCCESCGASSGEGGVITLFWRRHDNDYGLAIVQPSLQLAGHESA